jgi:ABC-type branched-subunit amino acid transport system ATPase component
VTPVLSVSRLTRRFNELTVLDGVDCELHAQSRWRVCCSQRLLSRSAPSYQ